MNDNFTSDERQDAVWDRAALWVDKEMGGAQVDRAELAQWLQTPAHRKAYDALKTLQMDRALDGALSEFAATPGKPLPRLHPKTRTARVYWLSGGLVAAAYAAAMLFVFQRPIEILLAPKLTYVTRPGETRDLRLKDGTHIAMNGDSQIQIVDDGHVRHARLLRGEAMFEVQHDASRPFDVALEHGKVEDIGTRFDIDMARDGYEVRVFDGEVRVRGQKSFMPLTPGQRALLTGGDVTSLSSFDARGGDWRDGWIEPQDWTLERVTAALSRASGQKIVIADPALRTLRVSGRLRLDHPQQQLHTLALIHGFDVVAGANTLTITRAAKSNVKNIS